MHLSPNYSRITKQTFSIVDEPLYESMSDSDDKDSSRSDVGGEGFNDFVTGDGAIFGNRLSFAPGPSWGNGG